ncbi:MAG: response regulator [Myxococcota bacterium]
MPGPHVLLIDDDPLVLRAVRRALRHTRPDWAVVVASTPAEVFVALSTRAADVVVSDVQVGTHDGLALLSELGRRWPDMLRVVFTASEEACGDPEMSAVAHRIVSKETDPRALLATIEDALTARAWISSEELRRIVFGARDLPSAPEIAPKLRMIARDPTARVRDLADVVARDPAVSARVLRIASSVFYGGGRRIKTLEEAVARLGVRTLQALVLDAEIAKRFSVPTASGITAEQLARHSFQVARIALRIGQDVAPELAETAYFAGVVHDVGQLVLADRDPARLAQDRRLAERSGQPLDVVEAERHGNTHATVGAALLHLWSFERSLVEGVADHHRAPSERPAGIDVGTILWMAQAAARSPEEALPEVAVEVAALGWGTRFSLWRDDLTSIA